MSDPGTDSSRDPLRVLLDATGLGSRDSLADEYVVELAKAAGRQHADVVVVCKPRDAKLFKSFDLEVHRAPERVVSERQRRWWISWGLAKFAREHGAHVIHSPHDVYPTSGRVRRVLAVHDPVGDPIARAYRSAVTLRVDVVAPSSAVAHDILDATGAPANRVHVAHRGINKSIVAIPQWEELTAFSDTYGASDWIAVVASSDSMESFEAFCDGFRRATEFGESRPTLIVTGVDDAVALRATTGLINAGFDVRLVADIPDGERNAFLGGSLFSVILDNSHRTGRALVEAMMCGATVVTPTEPVFIELAHDAVEFAEPIAASMEIAITALLTNPERRQSLATSAVT
ncbi:MAG: hypothetical protein RLZ72_1265, partial [Actinomycetota bacterium]